MPAQHPRMQCEVAAETHKVLRGRAVTREDLPHPQATKRLISETRR